MVHAIKIDAAASSVLTTGGVVVCVRVCGGVCVYLSIGLSFYPLTLTVCPTPVPDPDSSRGRPRRTGDAARRQRHAERRERAVARAARCRWTRALGIVGLHIVYHAYAYTLCVSINTHIYDIRHAERRERAVARPARRRWTRAMGIGACI